MCCIKDLTPIVWPGRKLAALTLAGGLSLMADYHYDVRELYRTEVSREALRFLVELSTPRAACHIKSTRSGLTEVPKQVVAWGPAASGRFLAVQVLPPARPF